MNCANNYCIYNKGFGCILDGINLNSKGMCDDCIMVNISEDILEIEKKNQLNAMEIRG